MALTLEYNTHAPGINAERMRSDFEAIWKQNVSELTITTLTNPQAGDYFNEGEPATPVVQVIWANVQGVSSDDYKRTVPGISTTGSIYHAYVRHFEVLDNLDQITWKGNKYRIKNMNKGIHTDGSIVFIEFDMERVDKSG